MAWPTIQWNTWFSRRSYQDCEEKRYQAFKARLMDELKVQGYCLVEKSDQEQEDEVRK